MEIDTLIDNDPKSAYEKMKKMLDDDKNLRRDVEFLCKLARLCFNLAKKKNSNDESRKKLFFEGKEIADLAHSIDEEHFDALRWKTIYLGETTSYLSNKDKVQQGIEFKKYLDIAISKQPTEYTLLHSRGRYFYEICNLSWVEKNFCKLFYGKLPNVTIDDALNDFLEAGKQSPRKWADNILYIALCYARKNEQEMAMKYLNETKENVSEDDNLADAINKASTLIMKLT